MAPLSPLIQAQLKRLEKLIQANQTTITTAPLAQGSYLTVKRGSSEYKVPVTPHAPVGSARSGRFT